MTKQEEDDWHFNVVRVKYINLDSGKSILFTKLKSSMSQRRTQIMYKINSGVDCNLMPLNIFKCIFPKSTVESLCSTKIVWQS